MFCFSSLHLFPLLALALQSDGTVGEIGSIFLSRSSCNLFCFSHRPLTHEQLNSLKTLLCEIFREASLLSSLNSLFLLCVLFFSPTSRFLLSPSPIIPTTDSISHSLELLKPPLLGGHPLGCIAGMTKKKKKKMFGSLLQVYFLSPHPYPPLS